MTDGLEFVTEVGVVKGSASFEFLLPGDLVDHIEQAVNNHNLGISGKFIRIDIPNHYSKVLLPADGIFYVRLTKPEYVTLPEPPPDE